MRTEKAASEEISIVDFHQRLTVFQPEITELILEAPFVEDDEQVGVVAINQVSAKIDDEIA